MQSIVFLGPDRVGKTTLIRNTLSYLKGLDFEVNSCHFGKILPEHHSPVDQFRRELGGIEHPGPDFLLLDRFVSDTMFYEEIRKQMPRISSDCYQEPESILLDVSTRVDVVIVQSGWNQQMINRHITELRTLNPRATTYWINGQLELRREEHKKYYDHTNKFFQEKSLLNNVHKISSHLQAHVFTMCPSIPIPER